MSDSLYVCYKAETSGVSRTFFALSSSDAAERAKALGIDAEPGQIQRAPWGDRFSSRGSVPALLVLSRGFSVGCAECGALIESTGAAVLDSDDPYCSVACSKARDAKAQSLDSALKLGVERARELWPDAEIVNAVIIQGRPRIHFTYGRARHAFWFADADMVDISPTDKAEWLEFLGE